MLTTSKHQTRWKGSHLEILSPKNDLHQNITKFTSQLTQIFDTDNIAADNEEIESEEEATSVIESEPEEIANEITQYEQPKVATKPPLPHDKQKESKDTKTKPKITQGIANRTQSNSQSESNTSNNNPNKST